MERAASATHLDRMGLTAAAVLHGDPNSCKPVTYLTDRIDDDDEQVTTSFTLLQCKAKSKHWRYASVEAKRWKAAAESSQQGVAGQSPCTARASLRIPVKSMRSAPTNSKHRCKKKSS